MKTTLIVCCLMVGCMTFRAPIARVWEPRTEEGRAFKQRHIGELQVLVEIVRQFRGIGDVEARVMLEPGIADPVRRYVGIAVGTTTTYNTLKTRFEERAATNAVTFLMPLLRAILNQHEIRADTSVIGTYISIAWIAQDFSEAWDAGDKEGFNLFSAFNDADAFVKMKLSNQDFLDRSILVGFKNDYDTGRFRLNLSRNL